jgi:hypothetical protein
LALSQNKTIKRIIDDTKTPIHIKIQLILFIIINEIQNNPYYLLNLLVIYDKISQISSNKFDDINFTDIKTITNTVVWILEITKNK